MNENKTRAVALPTDFSPAHWQAVKEMCNTFIKSGALPSHIKNAETAIMVVQAGSEMGIPPMQALSTLYPVNGKIAMEGKAMLKKLRLGGVGVKWDESTDEKCTVTLTRPEDREDTHTETFTKQDAQQAGLLGKDNWKKYPKDMLRWKALSRAARFHCPDITEGLYLLEEVADFEDSRAKWTDQGVVVDAVDSRAEKLIKAIQECPDRATYTADILPEINEQAGAFAYEDRIAVNKAVEKRLDEWAKADSEKKKAKQAAKKSEEGLDKGTDSDDLKVQDAEIVEEDEADGEPETEEDIEDMEDADEGTDDGEVFQPTDDEFDGIIKKILSFKKQTQLIEFMHNEIAPMPLSKKQKQVLEGKVSVVVEKINGRTPTEADLKAIFGR